MANPPDHKESLNPIAAPPIFRFLVELTTWTWLLVIGLIPFNINLFNVDTNSRVGLDPWVFLVLLAVSLLILGLLNFPGDKKTQGIPVPGWIRIGVEIFSGFLGVFAAWVLFDLAGGLLQLFLVLFAFFLDRERWKWFLGLRSDPPAFVKALGHYHE